MTVTLDWSSASHWNRHGPAPCVLCGQGSWLLSDRGRPCHKVCAEHWLTQRGAPAAPTLTSAA